MITITKKQISLAVFAVVFATAMIVGTLASAGDNIAFAHKKTHSQSISLNSEQNQRAFCQTAGGHSSVSESCNNFASSHQRNSGGDANAQF